MVRSIGAQDVQPRDMIPERTLAVLSPAGARLAVTADLWVGIGICERHPVGSEADGVAVDLVELSSNQGQLAAQPVVRIGELRASPQFRTGYVPERVEKEVVGC